PGHGPRPWTSAGSARRPPGGVAARGGAGTGGPASGRGGCRAAPRGRAGGPWRGGAGGCGRKAPAGGRGRAKAGRGPFPGCAGGEGPKPAGPERAEVALDGGSGHAGEAGEVVVGQPLGLEPKDFHLALDERFGVVVAVERDGRQVVVGEGDARHGRFPAW